MALDNFKKTSMRIDKANQRFLDYQNAKVGDVNGRELLVQITNNGVVEDQTGTTLKLNWQHENGNQGSTSFSAVDITTGKYSLYYPSKMLYKGTVDASVEINSNGQTTNTMNFKIIVHADVFDGEAGTVNGVFISLADVNKKLDDREREYVELKERQTSVETQFNSVQQELTDKDPISAPEIIAARNGEANLKARLDKEQQEVNTQLDQIANGTFINALNPPEGFSPLVPDANFYDEVNKKYYKDEEMTIPATDNRGRLTSMVWYLNQNGGGTILLPAGKMCFRSGVKWESDVSLIGAGMQSTELVVEGELFDLFYSNKSYSSTGSDAGNPDVWHNNCRFENLSVDLIGLTSPYNNVAGKAFFILYMNRPVFRNLILKNTIGTALGNDFLVHGVIENVWTYNAGRNWGVQHPTYGYIRVGQSGIGVGTGAFDEEPLVIQNCFTFNSGNYGIFVETQRTNMRSKFAKIINCFATGNRIGFGNRGSGATLFDGVTAFKNKEDGIRLRHGSSGDQIVNSQISHNTQDGIAMEDDYIGNVIIANNDIHNNRRGIVSAGSLETETSTKDLFIQHNKIHYNSEAGIYLARSLPVNEHYIVDGNKIYSNGGTGLHVAGVDGLSVLNNVFYDKQEPALQTIPIQIEQYVKNYFIDGNDFGQDLQYRFYSLDGKIGDNEGLSNVAKGTATFEDGSAYVNITHNLGRPFETVVPDNPVIITTPYRDPKGGVWVSSYVSRNTASLFRENTVGELTVNWLAIRQ